MNVKANAGAVIFLTVAIAGCSSTGSSEPPQTAVSLAESACASVNRSYSTLDEEAESLQVAAKNATQAAQSDPTYQELSGKVAALAKASANDAYDFHHDSDAYAKSMYDNSPTSYRVSLRESKSQCEKLSLPGK